MGLELVAIALVCFAVGAALGFERTRRRPGRDTGRDRHGPRHRRGRSGRA